MAEKKYKVATLSISGKGNKIFRLGDEVTENQLLDFDWCLAQKAIVAIDPKEEVGEDDEKSIEKMTVSELEAYYVETHNPSTEDIEAFNALSPKAKKVEFLLELED